MAKGYRPVARDQQFLLPPDMREWLPADHAVWLVIDAVAGHLDTAALHRGRGTGGGGAPGGYPLGDAARLLPASPGPAESSPPRVPPPPSPTPLPPSLDGAP